MKILIAPDKFKGSLNSVEVCQAIEKGLLLASSSFQITKLPLADGGDGLADVIAYYTNATRQAAVVADPLFEDISAYWLLSSDKKTAFIEMAQASGLHLLRKEQYDPSRATTYGTGQLIRAAIESGAREIMIGIGGSATNDGGTGMAAALGYRFLDKEGKELSPVGGNLIRIRHIDASNKTDLHGIRFRVACDVKNVLCGENGATRVYGPQKGASSAMIEELEEGMMNYAAVIKKDMEMDVLSIEGGGAAGGMGAGCMAFLGATLKRGADIVFEYSNAKAHIEQADLIITAEGKLDGQTLEGKLVAGVAALSKRLSKPVIAVCGSIHISPAQLQQLGVAGAFSIMQSPMTLEEAIQNAEQLLSDTSFSIGSLLAAF